MSTIFYGSRLRTKMDRQETGTTFDDVDEIFEMRTANECLAEAADEQPVMLFGDLWLTGELSVAFAEPAGGTSLLGVQIAESIARGKPIQPFEMEAPAPKVLYIDLEQSAAQFRRRYTAEGAKTKQKRPPKQYRFSDNFLRPLIKGIGDLRVAMLAPLIESTGAKVLIIDNIAYLQRYSIPRETAAAMRELRQLKERYGLSILVLTHTARSSARRGIEAADMACSSAMITYADNIFAIGRSRSDSSARYIKHIRPGATALAFGAAHLPWFLIVKRGGTFTSFQFEGYTTEADMCAGDDNKYEIGTIREIKQRHVRGETIRKIAAEMSMARSTVQRYLKMAPEAWGVIPQEPQATKPPEPVFYRYEKCIYERCYGCRGCDGLAAHNRFTTPGSILGHGACPDDCDICGPRRYSPDDTSVDPRLKKLSDDHYEAPRTWLIEGKRSPRPKYPGERRYGHEKAQWKPGSEHWAEEQLNIYDRWLRTQALSREPEPAWARL